MRNDSSRVRRSVVSDHLVPWLVQYAVLYAVWLLFTCSTTRTELTLGAMTCILGATASHVVLCARLVPIWGHLSWFAEAWRLPRYVISDTWEVLVVLARQWFLGRPAPSMVLAVPYDSLGDDADSCTRRALAITYTTISPNFIVLGIDRNTACMLYHQIAQTEIPVMTRHLGAVA